MKCLTHVSKACIIVDDPSIRMLQTSIRRTLSRFHCILSRPVTSHGPQVARYQATMAPANGAIGTVDPKTDKTLKLENVRRQHYPNLCHANGCSTDRKKRFLNRDRGEVPETMARIRCIQCLCSFNSRDTCRVYSCVGDTEAVSQVLWHIRVPLHEWHFTRRPQFHRQQS